MLIHLIRHGETDWNAIRRVQGQLESSLTENGRRQAAELAPRLRQYAIGQVYCSSSRRTRETADILFAGLDLPILYRDNLREIHLGPWEGNLYDHLAEQYPDQFRFFFKEPHRFSLQGAESFQQLQERGIAALRELCAQTTKEQVAVVSHGALIKAMLCHYEKRPLDRLWEPPKMPNCAHSILEVERDASGRILLYAGVSYVD
jgi:probable phosphoglycerate mutase